MQDGGKSLIAFINCIYQTTCKIESKTNKPSQTLFCVCVCVFVVCTRFAVFFIIDWLKHFSRYMSFKDSYLILKVFYLCQFPFHLIISEHNSVMSVKIITVALQKHSHRKHINNIINNHGLQNLKMFT